MRRAVTRSGPLAATLLLLAVAAATAAALRGAASHGEARWRAPGTFAIRGAVTGPLLPGVRRGINLVLTNPQSHPLLVRRLHVRGRVDAAHRSLGCAMRRDVRVRQLERGIRFVLPANSVRSLSDLGLRRWPAVTLRRDPLRNQDACKGATVSLRYRGWAGKQSTEPSDASP